MSNITLSLIITASMILLFLALSGFCLGIYAIYKAIFNIKEGF